MPFRQALTSGRTSISQALSCFGVASVPRPSFPASAGVLGDAAMSVKAKNMALGNFNIFNLAIGFDMPGLDAIVVVDGVGAAHLAQFVADFFPLRSVRLQQRL